MKICSTEINFGKQLVATCNIKKANVKHAASIYKYDPHNTEDIEEIEKIMPEGPLKSSFRHAGFWTLCNGYGDFYMLKDRQTHQIMSGVEIKKYYMQSSNKLHVHKYISIQELQKFGSEDCHDSLTPIVGYIAHQGWANEAEKITTAYRTDEGESLENYKFNVTDYDTWMLPQRRFEENMLKAEKKNQLEFKA